MSYTCRSLTLPDHLKESIDAYVETGRPTGGFLRAVINNDLVMAVGLADEENLPLLPVFVWYLYNECPRGCFGFSTAWSEWIARKRAEREAKQ